MQKKNKRKKEKWAGFWLNSDQLLVLGFDLIIWFRDFIRETGHLSICYAMQNWRL